jgi:glycosyltransferase involved in cell wall biosynthesis
MIKSKGYFEVLKLAKSFKNKNYNFHFAGGWQSKEDEIEFFDFIKDNSLENTVTFHGFVNGNQKKNLFENTSIFVFPTRYENEAFPLSILESFSYGVPVLTTDEGSIPFIVDDKSGIVMKDINTINEDFQTMIDKYISKETSIYCRKRYIENFSLEHFEENLIKVFV